VNVSAKHQKKEAIKRRDAGEPTREIERMFNVSHSTIRLDKRGSFDRSFGMRTLLVAISGFVIPIILFGSSQAFAACSECREMDCSGHQIVCGSRDRMLKARCEAGKAKSNARCEFRKSTCYSRCIKQG
jgi:hypothetical protein